VAAHDASHYLLIPEAVVTPRSAAEVAALFVDARRNAKAITFRSGGTSLSGQASTSGLLVDTRSGFRGWTVLDGGAVLSCEPGVTVRRANAALARYGRRLGPDPASEVACTIGGIVANNSSGMSCGTHANPYATIRSVVAVLASGTVIDTGAPDADDRLRTLEPDLVAGLERLRDLVRHDPSMAEVIERRFAMKNTMGYAANAFLDHTTPADLLTHLLVGSEGTLGFVAEARFDTLPIETHIATGLVVFESLAAATAALPALVTAGLSVIELMDAASLRVAQRLVGCPDLIASLSVVGHAALLIEHHATAAADLAAKVESLEPVLASLGLTARLTSEAGERAALWKVRKGLYTAVAGARPSGTTALLEDVCVPVPSLLACCEGLVALFDRHGYDSSVIFGHARDGNIHFLVNEDFTRPGGHERYQAFTADMVDLVLSLDGNLKAEHGTGRIMAPYVRRQYGDEVYEVMREIKRLFDPAGILNPGVVIAETDTAALKLPVTVEVEVDRCVECGYCEPVCPSKDLTLTPRQRIVLRREIAAARARDDEALAAELERDEPYESVDTCAVDGMCETACPVTINTGDLVRRLRAEAHGGVAGAAWDASAATWGAVTRVGGLALSVADRLPSGLAEGATALARRILPPDVMPMYDGGLPAGGTLRRPGMIGTGRVTGVYVPACIQTMFGPEDSATSGGVMAAVSALCDRAGIALLVPDQVASLCCGTPWKSKGHLAGYERMKGRVVPTLLRASALGALPLISDAASCTEGFRTMGLEVEDLTTWARREVLPRVTVTRPYVSVAVHPTCSTTHLGTTPDLVALAGAISRSVVVPDDWGCCAFAGDRGLLHPELTASATAAEAAEVTAHDHDAYVSANRTCELGLTRATGRPYMHVVELLERATRP
jgi:D-lactate dehydrogenase